MLKKSSTTSSFCSSSKSVRFCIRNQIIESVKKTISKNTRQNSVPEKPIVYTLLTIVAVYWSVHVIQRRTILSNPKVSHSTWITMLLGWKLPSTSRLSSARSKSRLGFPWCNSISRISKVLYPMPTKLLNAPCSWAKSCIIQIGPD